MCYMLLLCGLILFFFLVYVILKVGSNIEIREVIRGFIYIGINIEFRRKSD